MNLQSSCGKIVACKNIQRDKGVVEMVQLAQEIDEAKGELYAAIESNESLISKEVYTLSSKLDKLIFEYQLKAIDNGVF